MYFRDVDMVGRPTQERRFPPHVAALRLQPYMRETQAELVPIVCIGLSAGGVEPLRTIFRWLGPATGMAFVVVPHLSPERPNLLPRLLSWWSAMPVQEARAGLQVEPNHIYVVPSGDELKLEDERFCLRPRSKAWGWPNIITVFLDSLTKWRQPPGVAVILSGLDCDGSAALRQFQSQGGITIAQDPDTADYAEMPRAAIKTGSIDYVLTPEAIVGELEAIGKEFGTGVGASAVSRYSLVSAK